MTDFVPEPLGKYTLTRRIAKGGMAEIFLATQRGPAGFEKELVVKRILPHLASDEAFITMFLDEARLAARLAHPNCVQIFELGEEQGAFYIAMEYVRGPNLSTVIRKLREHNLRMPLHYAAWIVARAAAGLDFAHSMKGEDGHPLGLVHRDISPDNILVTEQGAVKMIDFGVAKAQSNETKTIAGTIKGKLRYMSPEQVQGRALDGRSDLFSLGIVLYELTTLRRPFGGTSELATVSAIITDPPEPPSRAVAGYPPALEAIIERALAKDPDQRFATAHAMQDALEAFVHTRGVYLTDREVGAYLARLFSESDQDLAALRELPSGLHTAIRGDVSGESETMVGRPTAGRGEVTAAAAAPAPAPRRSPVGAIVAAIVIVLLAAAAAVWFFVLAPKAGPAGGGEGGADAGMVVAAADAGTAPRRRDPEGLSTERGGIDSPRDARAAVAPDSGGAAVAKTPDAGGTVAAGPDAGATVAAGPDAGAPVAAGPDAGAAVGAGPDAGATVGATVGAGPDVGATAAGADVAPQVAAADVAVRAAAPDVAPQVPTADVAPQAAAPDVPAPTALADAARQPPPKPEKAWLIVRGPRGSLVVIDGRSYGERVNEKIAVRPGRHKVVLHLPKRGGRREDSVRVAPDETLKVTPR